MPGPRRRPPHRSQPSDAQSARHESSSAQQAGSPAGGEQISGGTYQLRRDKEGQWALFAPRCVAERADDLEEVEAMLDAEEIDIARDELRYLLNGCTDHLQIHFLLGELALAERDFTLARGHYGYAFEIGKRAIQRAGNPRPIAADLTANELWFHAGKQLAWCLKLLEKPDLMRAVVDFLTACDPRDPLQLKTLL